MSETVRIENLEDQEWLCSVKPSKTVYFPQLGDQVVYLPQAYEKYLEVVEKKKLYDIDESDKVWTRRTFKVHEEVKVVEVKFTMRQIRLCCLKFELSDETTFNVKYRHLDGVADFLVLRKVFEAAVRNKWRLHQRVRRLIGKVWFYGQVTAVQDFNRARYPGSQYKRIRVEWEDNKRIEDVSPWDIELVKADECSECRNYGFDSCTLTCRPEPDGWPHDGSRDLARQRCLKGLRRIMGQPYATPFLGLNEDLSYFSAVKYPVDLQTIHERLKYFFYRRAQAMRFDVEMLYENFIELESRAAFNIPELLKINIQKITEDLLKMIENSTAEYEGPRIPCHSPETYPPSQPNKRSKEDSSNDTGPKKSIKRVTNRVEYKNKRRRAHNNNQSGLSQGRMMRPLISMEISFNLASCCPDSNCQREPKKGAKNNCRFVLPSFFIPCSAEDDYDNERTVDENGEDSNNDDDDESNHENESGEGNENRIGNGVRYEDSIPGPSGVSAQRTTVVRDEPVAGPSNLQNANRNNRREDDNLDISVLFQNVKKNLPD